VVVVVVVVVVVGSGSSSQQPVSLAKYIKAPLKYIIYLTDGRDNLNKYRESNIHVTASY